MPEGDSLHRIAATLRALVGGEVIAMTSPLPEVAAAAERARGRRVDAVEARGKNLLVWLATPDGAARHALYTHLRMSGRWHLYRAGDDWRKPSESMRVRLDVRGADGIEWQAVCFSAPTVQWLSPFEVRRHPVLSTLGPDLLGDDWGPPVVDDIVARLRRDPARPLGDAIMDQRLVAGIGNVYKSELLFMERLDPFAPMSAFDDASLRRLIASARTWMRRNLGPGRRRTRWDHSTRRTWVYGRGGEPCGVCGEVIRMRRQGELGRSTYHCPRCQGVEATEAPAPRGSRRGRVIVRGPAE